MVRSTEPDKPLPFVSEGPLDVPLPTKAEASVVTVTVAKPTLWQKVKSVFQKVKP